MSQAKGELNNGITAQKSTLMHGGVCRRLVLAEQPRSPGGTSRIQCQKLGTPRQELVRFQRSAAASHFWQLFSLLGC